MAQGDAVPLRVLIVEDSEDDMFFLVREIKQGGYELDYRRVYSLDDIKKALETTQWDLVLSDYRLPGFCALDVLKTVRDSGRHIPVIIVSGAIGEDLAVEAMHAGAHDYIMKDHMVRLVPAIERELKEMEVHKQRTRAESALRESEEHFRQLAGNIEGVLWIIDCEKKHMIFISASYEQIWERPAEPLFDSLDSFLDSVHPEDYARVQALLDEKGWAGFNEEYRIQRMDGSERWINTRSFPIRAEDGEVYRIAGLSSDVTEHKRLENEMKKMSRALDQTADAVMITDRNGVIEYVNPAFEAVTGYSLQEAVGQRPSMLKSGMHETDFYGQLWQSLVHGMPFNDVFINRRKNGDLYYESKTITPVRDEHGDVTHFVATGKDITERLRKRKDREQLMLYDASTGLANRTLFTDRLQQTLLQARRAKSMAAVLSIGFDLTELFGEGRDSKLSEKLLLKVVQRLQEAVRESDAIARLSRDDFAIIQRESTSREHVEKLARRIIESFAEPVSEAGYELYIMPRMGISLYPDDGDDTDSLIRKAEIAMNNARYVGQRGYCFYSHDMKPPGGTRPGARTYSS